MFTSFKAYISMILHGLVNILVTLSLHQNENQGVINPILQNTTQFSLELIHYKHMHIHSESQQTSTDLSVYTYVRTSQVPNITAICELQIQVISYLYYDMVYYLLNTVLLIVIFQEQLQNVNFIISQFTHYSKILKNNLDIKNNYPAIYTNSCNNHFYINFLNYSIITLPTNIKNARYIEFHDVSELLLG